MARCQCRESIQKFGAQQHRGSIGTADTWNTRITNVREGGMAAIADAVISRWFSEDFVKKFPESVEATRQMLLHSASGGLRCHMCRPS